MSEKPAVLGGQPIFETKVPIVRPWLPSYEAMQTSIKDILSTRMVTKGRYLASFEEAVARRLGVKHAIGVSSCTSGLMLVYRCLGLTGEVVVPSFTFMATVSALVWAGLKPVFVDVNRQTTNMEPTAAEAAITPRTTALVAVHNFGAPAEAEGLQAAARRRGLKLVFDAAHGMGSLYRNRSVGGFGDAEVFSLSPTKLLISGEGGIVATNDGELARKIRLGREYGNSGNYDSEFAGLNARMAEFNALLGLRSLELLEESVKNRNRYAELYRQRLSDVPGLAFQAVDSRDRSSYKDLSLTVDPKAFGMSRDELSRALQAENIDIRHYYDPPVHRQEAYRGFASPAADLVHTDFLAEHCLSLPIHSQMDEKTIEGVCRAVQRIQQHAPSIRRG